MKIIGFPCIMGVLVFLTACQHNKTTKKQETAVNEQSSITTNGTWFKDRSGRTLLLRGINLGGSSKMPYRPYIVSHVKKDFYKGAEVSFIGRPFPLEEADIHFQRLQHWGFHTLRFLVTWEAIEHEGPGIYDEAYLDYLYKIVKKAGEYDISVFIDPHQDVWSRFTGGDGAPLWTLEKVGFLPQNFDASGVSFSHNVLGDPYPKMQWYTNNFKLAAGTMFTLFWGGNDYAPKTKIDGIPVQEYLQSHFIGSMQQVVKKLADLSNVIGYETMNEPGEGFIEVESIMDWKGSYTNGFTPTLWQSLLLASGRPQMVEVWEYSANKGMHLTAQKKLINPEGIKAWKDGYEGVWQENGVWEINNSGTPKLLKPGYFKVDSSGFLEAYFKPFVTKYITAIREYDKDALVFIEPPVGLPLPHWKEDRPEGVVDASHWYDVHALLSKQYNPEFTINYFNGQSYEGAPAVKQSFVDQLKFIKERTMERKGSIPTVIGEFGLPIDLNSGEAFHTGDYSMQIKALDTYFDALEQNLLHYTLWNYTADNTNERGDQWNGEDLSIFSNDQRNDKEDINSGGRALAAVVRPYPRKVAGNLLAYDFDLEARRFTMEFTPDPKIIAPTEIFVPSYHFKEGYEVRVSGGTYDKEPEKQRLLIYPEEEIDNIVLIVTQKK